MKVIETKNNFKPSKIGMIPLDWGFYNLNEIASITRLAGYEYSKYWEEEENGDIIALRGFNIGNGKLNLKNVARISRKLSNKLKRSQLSKGDIVYPCVGSIGNAVVISQNDKFHMQQNLAKISCKDLCDPFFLEQFLRSELANKEVYRFNATTTQPNVLVGSLRQFRISLPPISEQKKISELLITWDKAIEKTQQLIDQLELRKKGLMQELLSGKNRLPGFYGEWKTMKISQLFNEIKDRNDGGSHEPLTISAKTGFVSQKKKFDKVIAGSSLQKYIQLQRGDFSYNKGNSKSYPMGCIYLLEKYNSAVVPFVYISFRPKDIVEPEYYRYWFENHGLDKQLKAIITSGARGDGLLNVSKKDFFSLNVPFPPKNEQKAISSVLIETDTEIKLQNEHLDYLKSQKKGLMQQLLTGKKRVKI